MKTSSSTTAPALYTVPQAAAQLQISTRYLYRLIASGELRTIHIGSAHRVPATELQAFIERSIEVAAS